MSGQDLTNNTGAGHESTDQMGFDIPRAILILVNKYGYTNELIGKICGVWAATVSNWKNHNINPQFKYGFIIMMTLKKEMNDDVEFNKLVRGCVL